METPQQSKEKNGFFLCFVIGFRKFDCVELWKRLSKAKKKMAFSFALSSALGNLTASNYGNASAKQRKKWLFPLLCHRLSLNLQDEGRMERFPPCPLVNFEKISHVKDSFPLSPHSLTIYTTSTFNPSILSHHDSIRKTDRPFRPCP